MQQRPDVCIAGAGIIGLALALELNHLGASVCVLERDTPLAHASQAAAGMLAAHDPDNPPALLPLSELSLALYPAFLDRIARLSGQPVPFHTGITFQSVEHAPAPASLPPGITPHGHTFRQLSEHSLDPRQLAPALLAAVRATPIQLLPHTALRTVTQSSAGLHVETIASSLSPRQIVFTLGPWSIPPVAPRKGQMLSVLTPPSLALDYVLRTPGIYVVPRTLGPHAGRALIGATVEDAGFSTTTDPASLAALRARAARFLPALADEVLCPTLESWAGLRPYTPDHLPLLGPLPNRPAQFLATGHYRNGILLAPATARIMAQLLAGKPPTIPLHPFAPDRFPAAPPYPQSAPIFAHSM